MPAGAIAGALWRFVLGYTFRLNTASPISKEPVDPMFGKTVLLVFALFLASVAPGQAPAEESIARVLSLVHAQTAQDVQEIGLVIRAVSEIRQLAVDTERKSLAVRGTTGQIALAEWLSKELDQPPRQQTAGQQGQRTGSHEYRLGGGGEDLVRVFHLAHPAGPRELQEIATVVRSTADIRWLFTYNAAGTITVRGTAAKLALAEWLIKELDQPTGGQPSTRQGQQPLFREYMVESGGDDVVRVFYLTSVRTPQRLQEIGAQVRTTARARRLFTYIPLNAIAMRGTSAEISLADRGRISAGALCPRNCRRVKPTASKSGL